MLNWCQNVIVITGHEEDIKSLYDANMSFNAFIPISKYCDAKNPTGIETLYRRKHHWGTKWDIVGEDGNLIYGNNVVLDEDGNIQANVLTASSPPIAFFEHLTSEMDDLFVTIQFWEPCDEMLGSVQIYKGHTQWVKIRDDLKFIRQWFCEDWEVDTDDI